MLGIGRGGDDPFYLLLAQHVGELMLAPWALNRINIKFGIVDASEKQFNRINNLILKRGGVLVFNNIVMVESLKINFGDFAYWF